MMRVRRHHLIEEAKAELDLAYNEVKRAETRIMELEFEFNERIKSQQNNGSDLAETQALNEEKERLQSDFDIEQLYEVQNEAVQRFARISSSFAIVGSIDDEKITVDLIKRLLFKDDAIRVSNMSIEKKFASSKRACASTCARTATRATTARCGKTGPPSKACWRPPPRPPDPSGALPDRAQPQA